MSSFGSGSSSTARAQFGPSGATSSNDSDLQRRYLKSYEARENAVKAFIKESSSRYDKKSHCVGWLHYREDQQRHVMVRLSRGGGTREVALEVEASMSEVLEKAAGLFFPNGTSAFAGDAAKYDLALGNVQGEIIDEPFTVGSYCTQMAMTRPRVYLLSKQKKSEIITVADDKHPEEHSESDSVCQLSNDSEEPEVVILFPCSDSEELPLATWSGGSSLGITSTCTSTLESETDVVEGGHPPLSSTPIPSDSSPSTILGASEQLQDADTVFDDTPEMTTYSALSGSRAAEAFPTTDVDPVVVFNYKRDIARRRESELALLDGTAPVSVRRQHVLDDLLHLYEENRGIEQKKLEVSFTEEMGVGDGVLRDLFSSFWRQFYSQYCEGFSLFVPAVRLHYEPKQYTTIGRILKHQYILLGTVPSLIAPACLFHALKLEVTDDLLEQAFLGIVTIQEQRVLKQAMDPSKDFPQQELLDLFSDYGLQRVPSRANFKEVLQNVASAEVLYKPGTVLLSIGLGMGDFFANMPREHLLAIIEDAALTPTKVVSSLSVPEETIHSARVIRWLVRYIESLEKAQLVQFVTFCTGASSLEDGDVIEVQLSNLSGDTIRPQAQTCFRLLKISRNYTTFNELKTNFDFYLLNDHLWAMDG